MSGKRKKENPLVQIHPRKPFFKRFWLDINRPIFGNKKMRIRFSRTSFPKPSLSWHPLRGFSLNTTHGARVSKSWKGFTLGFQNLNFVFRGRWSSGFFGLNLNAAKSGGSENLEIIKEICKLDNINIQVGGGIRTIKKINNHGT